MTVRELIEKLIKYPMEADVKVLTKGGSRPVEVVVLSLGSNTVTITDI